jgi:hypothetical protein
VRFSVTGLGSATVASAKLRLYVPSDGTADGPGIYGCTDPACATWSENAITWNARPPRASNATADTGQISGGTWVEYDVTPLVHGDGTHTLVIGPTPTSDGVVFSSREATANKPQLVVTPFADSGYARPIAATPITFRLVPAFQRCETANATHGYPLVAQSCSPPAQSSQFLTVGTPDANGQAAGSTGVLVLQVVGESPIDSSNGDQADVKITGQITDVRNRNDLSDYTGELEAVLGLRITDRLNGSNETTPATVTDTPLRFTIGCTATPDSIGGQCNVMTTVDAVTPGIAIEGKRSIWELSRLEIYDGGPDGIASTPDNTLFAVQGLFAP